MISCLRTMVLSRFTVDWISDCSIGLYSNYALLCLNFKELSVFKHFFVKCALLSWGLNAVTCYTWETCEVSLCFGEELRLCKKIICCITKYFIELKKNSLLLCNSVLVRSYLFRARLVSVNVTIKHSRVYACNLMQFLWACTSQRNV